MVGIFIYQEIIFSRMVMDIVMEMIRSVSIKLRIRLSEWIFCYNYYGVVCILGY